MLTFFFFLATRALAQQRRRAREAAERQHRLYNIEDIIATPPILQNVGRQIMSPILSHCSVAQQERRRREASPIRGVYVSVFTVSIFLNLHLLSSLKLRHLLLFLSKHLLRLSISQLDVHIVSLENAMIWGVWIWFATSVMPLIGWPKSYPTALSSLHILEYVAWMETYSFRSYNLHHNLCNTF
jgi:hypothetical protein